MLFWRWNEIYPPWLSTSPLVCWMGILTYQVSVEPLNLFLLWSSPSQLMAPPSFHLLRPTKHFFSLTPTSDESGYHVVSTLMYILNISTCYHLSCYHFVSSYHHLWASLVAQWYRICLQFRRCRLDPWVWKMPWRRAWQPTLVFLAGKSHRQRSLVGYSPWIHKKSDTIEATEHTHILCLGQTVSIASQWTSLLLWCPLLNIILEREATVILWSKRQSVGTSLVVQWLGICIAMQRMWFPSLDGELRSHMLQGN